MPDDITPTQDLSGIVGKHIIYTYANGWKYEVYYKNETAIDYRIHHGMVGGRWVRDQKAAIVQFEPGVYLVSWDEPTGTNVALTVDFTRRRLHGVIFFPAWVGEHPERTVLYQNDHLEQMRAYRDEGPTYPKLVIEEFAKITFLEDCGRDDQTVISCAPAELPSGYADRVN
ncbi:Phenolic acid decarboxylase [Segniliparus rotundus DSM 44985]|uniref:Phenolic acid decarboxylase n=1 Tax=Segniliparus rotundus (strain ATCC BAA-972 / CDC 1076 / CIP 108378 / DSM 44985 / JCM 13578) TaxID=640132 RepID=D6ZDU4_SEGRD|nr:phenolic acid decarboxylase [Segniliparus rotundus]ADG99351.1 Phenolic acid decarboxylase [Segniliparus rotundus DSM 44985]